MTAIVVTMAALVSAVSADDATVLAERFQKEAIPFLKRHCLECHGAKEPQAELNLSADADATAAVKRRNVWENALEMLTSGQMPPPEKPRPDEGDVEKFASLINALFDEADRTAKPDPGRVTVRRLNRVEYNNTIRDLMYVDFNATEDFPSDDVGHGFDNIGDVLTVSPVLMERYLSAAETIVNRAIVPNPPKPPERSLSGRYLEPAGRGVPETRFRTISTAPSDRALATGPLNTRYMIPDDGEYNFTVKCYAESPDDRPVEIAILACGKNVQNGVTDEEAKRFEGLAVNGLRPFVVVSVQEVKARKRDNAEHIRVKIPPTRGFDRVAVALVKRSPLFPVRSEGEPANALQPDNSEIVKLHVEYFALEGPLDTRPTSQRRLLACDATKPKPDQTREVLNRFLSRAYRRPPLPAELERLVVLVTLSQDEGLNWEGAVQRAMLATLVSPKFLFRLELDDRAESPEPRPLDDYQLASRLSYFLWASMPDEELFQLAAQGKLTENLEPQVRRMLADPKAQSLVDNFAMQWLQLRRLKTVAPDTKLFPAFNDRLRNAMLKETELFFEAIISEDRNILELIDADFTFLNEALARHYGIADTNGNLIGVKPTKPGGLPIRGPQFVKVNLQSKERGGLLTQASVLTVTSNPTRTSPVKRGRWILEQILGAPPPPPPPNVPELDEGQKGPLTGSLRQRMEQHRAKAACANCHAKMDPLGFAFENYDAIGARRDKDGEFTIETAGVLPGGHPFEGATELKSILSEQRSKLTRNLTQKLLTYALGRGLEHFDRRSVNKIQEAVDKGGGKFSTLAIEIAKSDPFRLRRGSE